MALYLGSSDKRKIVLNGVAYRLNLFAETPITNFIRLLSSDNYTLKDTNGLYLTVETTDFIKLLSLDNYILKDSNALYLTVEEDR